MNVCADFGSLVRTLVTTLYKKRPLSSEVLKEQINAVNMNKINKIYFIQTKGGNYMKKIKSIKFLCYNNSVKNSNISPPNQSKTELNKGTSQDELVRLQMVR